MKLPVIGKLLVFRHADSVGRRLREKVMMEPAPISRIVSSATKPIHSTFVRFRRGWMAATGAFSGSAGENSIKSLGNDASPEWGSGGDSGLIGFFSKSACFTAEISSAEGSLS